MKDYCAGMVTDMGTDMGMAMGIYLALFLPDLSLSALFEILYSLKLIVLRSSCRHYGRKMLEDFQQMFNGN